MTSAVSISAEPAEPVAGAPAPLAALLPARGEPADADTVFARFMA